MDDLFVFDGAEDLVRAWCDGLTPDPALTVSEWADRHRYLSPRASAEPGRYRTDRTPYMRAIMDALSPSHPCRRIVFMKAAQVGATEGGNCWIGYVIHHAPGPMLAVQPTVELAKRFSRQRIDPLIAESPALRERVKPQRSRDAGNTVLSKEFPAGLLVITGANSAVGLRSMPARYLFLDEVDAYPPSADEEGDPVALAEARTRTFSWRSKIFLTSTPTIHGVSRIEREFEASDQRRFFVPCRDDAVAEIRKAALGQGKARDCALSLRVLRRPHRRAPQDCDARRRRLAGDRSKRKPGRRDDRVSPLGALFADRLAVVGRYCPAVGSGANDGRSEKELQERRSRRDLDRGGRSARLAALV